VVQRARLGLLLHQQPAITSAAAARELGQSTSWVHKWRRRWATSGFSLEDAPRPGRRRRFSDLVRAVVIAIACELPCQRGLPLSRHFAPSVWQVVVREGVSMSLRTVQRILARDHLKPWRYVSWIHPRDPHFADKARIILDLYQGIWEGKPLDPRDQLVTADEKPSIQTRKRQVCAPGRGRAGRVESDYERGGALQYLAVWDVRRGVPWGRCELKNGIAAFDRLVAQVMAMEPYRSAPRVFWIVDQGSAHRGERARRRLQGRYPNLILAHMPVHASWLSQVECYFSIIHRKVLTPAAAFSLDELSDRILGFEALYRAVSKPFRWRFTRQDFDRRIQDLAA
jgi:transposase